MTVKDKIKKLIADTHGGQGYANACQVWRGYGEMGQEPYGWWIKPFGVFAYPIGKNWEEIKERW